MGELNQLRDRQPFRLSPQWADRNLGVLGNWLAHLTVNQALNRLAGSNPVIPTE